MRNRRRLLFNGVRVRSKADTPADEWPEKPDVIVMQQVHDDEDCVDTEVREEVVPEARVAQKFVQTEASIGSLKNTILAGQWRHQTRASLTFIG